MSNRLWSDISPSSGRRFWSDLDSAPGVVSPGTALVTINGNAPIVNQPTTVFRTPATAVITVQGLAPQAPVVLSPAAAVITAVGQIPVEILSRTIIPAVPAPQYSIPQDTIPTLITIMTVSPAPAVVTISSLTFNLTQGGNIGFVSPAPALVTLQTLQFTLLYGVVGVGQINVIGHAPTIRLELTIIPDVGQIIAGNTPPTLTLPFLWVDDDPVPPTTWINDRAA